jgi:hypothetical protein
MKTSLKIFAVIAVTLTMAFVSSSVLAQDPMQGDLEQKTLRQIPANAMEIKDISTIASFEASWTSVTNPGAFQALSYISAEKKLEIWIRLNKNITCKRSYTVKQAFETTDFIYLKGLADKSPSPSCEHTNWTYLLEISKNSKEGFYSVEAAQGTLKIR